jgi:hypothetical protein
VNLCWGLTVKWGARMEAPTKKRIRTPPRLLGDCLATGLLAKSQCLFKLSLLQRVREVCREF